MSQENLEQLIMRHEGFRNKIYKDSVGKKTIGIGHLITPKDKFKEGVYYSKQQLIEVFRTDLANAKFYANLLVQDWNLPEPAYNVIVSMIYQMGNVGLSKFKKFLACVKAHDWKGAKFNGLDSRWAKQTPKRALEQMKMLTDLL